jgi:alpha-galactosidase
MDIDPERLRTSEVVARRVAEGLGSRARIEATLDRRRPWPAPTTS